MSDIRSGSNEKVAGPAKVWPGLSECTFFRQ